MYNARYLLLIVYVTENSFLFLKYITPGACTSACIHCTCTCNRVYSFNLKKNNYSPEASGGLHAIWNTLLNFFKKWCIKTSSTIALYLTKC